MAVHDPPRTITLLRSRQSCGTSAGHCFFPLIGENTAAALEILPAMAEDHVDLEQLDSTIDPP